MNNFLGSGLLQSIWPKASDWLINDNFLDTRLAGSVNGTAATPGPGTRAATDTGSKLSVGAGVLASTGSTVPYQDPRCYYGSQSRASGIAIVAIASVASSGSYRVGWHGSASASPSLHAVMLHSDGNLYRYLSGGILSVFDGVAADTPYLLSVILRSSGALHLAKLSNAWKLLWVDNSDTTASLYAGSGVHDAAAASSLDYLRVIQLPAPFNSDTGLATDTKSGSVAAGTTFSHEADCLIEFAVTTLPSSDNIRFRFRYVSGSNHWYLLIEPSGNFTLYEVAEGSGTSARATAAGVVSNGDRIVIIAEKSIIKGYSNNILRWTYASATNFATATNGIVGTVGTGGVVSDLITWPRTLSGIAANILDKVSA